MSKKQTAVDWLFEQIARRQGSILHTIPFYNENQDLLIQAKEMEKNQIKESFDEGKDSEYEYHINNEPRINAEQYYQNTYEWKNNRKTNDWKLNVI